MLFFSFFRVWRWWFVILDKQRKISRLP